MGNKSTKTKQYQQLLNDNIYNNIFVAWKLGHTDEMMYLLHHEKVDINKVFEEAGKSNRSGFIDQYLENHPKVQAGKLIDSAICGAISANNWELVQKLLSKVLDNSEMYSLSKSIYMLEYENKRDMLNLINKSVYNQPDTKNKNKYIKEFINNCLEGAAARGDLESVQMYIKKGATNIGKSYVSACSNGHLNILQFFDNMYPLKSIHNISSIYQNSLIAASRGNQLEIIKYIITLLDQELGDIFNNYFSEVWINGVYIKKVFLSEPLKEAARYGHFNIVKYFIELRLHPNNYIQLYSKVSLDDIINVVDIARSNSHQEIVDYIIQL